MLLFFHFSRDSSCASSVTSPSLFFPSFVLFLFLFSFVSFFFLLFIIWSAAAAFVSCPFWQGVCLWRSSWCSFSCWYCWCSLQLLQKPGCSSFCVSLKGFLPYPVCDFFLGFAHPKPPVCHGPAFWQGVARNHPFAKRSNFSGLTTLLTRGWAAYLFEAKTAAEQKLFSILFVSLFKNLCLETLKPFWGTLAPPPKKKWILGTLPSPGAATFLQ